jgi:hypothetical protein
MMYIIRKNPKNLKLKFNSLKKSRHRFRIIQDGIIHLIDV